MARKSNKGKRKPKITHRQRALLRNMAKGMTQHDAAIAAGYSAKNPDQSAQQALVQIRKSELGARLLAKHGLDDDELIKSYLLPLMNAHETKFFQHNGKVKTTKNVIAWGPRQAGLDLALKIRGLTNPDQDGPKGAVTIIFDMPMPQPLLPAKPNGSNGQS